MTMIARMTFAVLTCGMVLGGCAQLGEGAGSNVPPMIGSPKDNLRAGVEPPSGPGKVRVDIYNPKAKEGGITRLRGEALKEAAQSYGSQMGYWRRSWEITNRLEANSPSLSQVFDFNRVVSAAPVKAGVVVPPVVSRSFDAFVSNDGGRGASVADEYLTIVSAGRIAPVAPTWRDYLISAAREPEKPPQSLSPADGAEKSLYEQWQAEGWRAGVEMADVEFEERMNRLKRDYTGMLQYRRLVAQGMMDRMVLANADFGVTKDGNEMRIGSRTVEIVSDAQFQANPRKWQVRSVSDRDALIVETGEIPSIAELR